MALSKKSITGLGVTLSAFALAMSGFFIFKPVYDQIGENQTSLENMKSITFAREMKVIQLEGGVENIEETKAFVNRFLQYAPRGKNIETISRAISESLVEGVTITSFNFGADENLEDYTVPVSNLEGNPAPIDLDAAAKEAKRPVAEPKDGEEPEVEKKDLFRRVPVVISLKAANYESFSNYVDSLAQQERLIVVMGLDSDKANPDEPLNATVYAYAFIYGES